MFSTHEEVEVWLKEMDIEDYTIREDLTVDVLGSVDLRGKLKELTELPVQFGTISNSFYCDKNNLTSLKGSPYSVRYQFNCSDNKITSLEYAPLYIGTYLYASNNPLKTLRNKVGELGGTISFNLIEAIEGFNGNEFYELSLEDINRVYKNIELSIRLDKELPNKESTKKTKL